MKNKKIIGIVGLLIGLLLLLPVFGVSNGLADAISGDKYDCVITVRADPLSKNNIVEPTYCDYTGESCLKGFSIFGDLSPIIERNTIKLFADCNVVLTKNIEQFTLTKNEYELSACVPKDANNLEFKLYKPDGTLEDTMEV